MSLHGSLVNSGFQRRIYHQKRWYNGERAKFPLGPAQAMLPKIKPCLSSLIQEYNLAEFVV